MTEQTENGQLPETPDLGLTSVLTAEECNFIAWLLLQKEVCALLSEASLKQTAASVQMKLGV